MKTKLLLSLATVAMAMTTATAQLPTMDFGQHRGMWASVNTVGNASLGNYTQHNNKLLISWRMLPTDTWDKSFLLFSRSATSMTGTLTRVTASPVKNATCFQVSSIPTTSRVYYLIDGNYFGSATVPVVITDEDQKAAFRSAALDSMLLGPHIYVNKLPYLTIPLKATIDVCTNSHIKYQANDCAVGDLDGDGEMEIVVKRLLSVYDDSGACISDGTGAGDSDRRTQHCVIWDAYKLDGTLLWRIKSGPNIILGNSSNFAVADLDGDGCAEFVTKTGEGTVFGDGKEIGDTNNDGLTDYRNRWPGHYTGDSNKGFGGPEFFSVCDGKTGKELARANFIARGPEGQTEQQWVTNYKNNSLSWGDDYWKRANSLRLGVASFKGDGTMQVFLGRGVYARTVVEGWELLRTPDTERGLEYTLSRMWKFDSSVAGGTDKNKDKKANSAYGGQGNHAFNVTDLDGDGKDEVMYGSAAFDDDGYGLWSTQLGHGDANHIGCFLPDREGMQVYHCLESGKTQVALHDAKDGSVIWKKVGTEDNDMGRCMVADIDKNSPGYEFWMYGNWVYSQTGVELGYNTGSCNMAIWFDGYLTRQLIDGNKIDGQDGRTFTVYRYDIGVNNGSKNNPGLVADFLGDWREELIMPDATHLKDLKIFSTWYPTQYKLPYLMSDHNYYMQTIHQQVGYNQPNHVGGYYLGNGMDFSKVPLEDDAKLNVKEMKAVPKTSRNNGVTYDLSGRAVICPKAGIYIRNGKKIVVE